MDTDLNFTTARYPTTTAAGSFLTRLDFISVAILGGVITVCTLICCFVGFKRRKLLPDESRVVDVQTTNETETNDLYAAELRRPHRGATQNIRGGPRVPDSPPPTYSVLERQTSFTSQISHSSSQIEMPPNYEEAAGLARNSLMSTLIPEEGPALMTAAPVGRSHRRSESVYQRQPERQRRTNRSKSDIEKSRRLRTPDKETSIKKSVDNRTEGEASSDVATLESSRNVKCTMGSTEPLLMLPPKKSEERFTIEADIVPLPTYNVHFSPPTKSSKPKKFVQGSTEV